MPITSLWRLGLIEMTNKLQFLMATLLLVGCQHKDDQRGAVSADLSAMPEFPKTLMLDVSNHTSDIMCISADQIESNFVNLAITQNRVRVYSNLNIDRPDYNYRTLNAMVPLFLVPPGKRIFEYDLSDFPLKSGAVSVDGNLKMSSCSDLFGNSGPRWRYVPVHGVFNYPLR